ncbi:hypothetical protein [Paenibacillus rhizolycopersici]|uniref:hypothetical protein n=1 Tax=Paenibacillus rhizolycopersici TaxID=2780073 RepID=UPI003D27D464
MTAEEIANDENRNWDERVRATAEVEYKKLAAKGEAPKRKREPLGLVDRAYIARFYDYDGATNLGALFGKKRQNIMQLVTFMKASGEYEMYKNLTDEEYEKIVLTTERSERNAL